jgi:hypothetical protein
MFSFTYPWRSSVGAGFGGVAVAAALFGGGVLAGQSTADTSPPTTTPTPVTTMRNSVTLPAVAADADVKDSGSSTASSGTAGSAMPIPPDGASCQAALPGVVDGTAIDLSKAGLTPRFPGDGFSLVSLSINAMGPCDGSGAAQPMLDSQWRHGATGLNIWVHQSVSESAPDVIQGTNATFFSDGYAFQVSVGGGVAYAVDSRSATGSGSAPSAKPGIAPGSPGGEDPRAAGVLQAVIAALAPSLSDACFAHQVTMGWDGLPALGIGDPRPAIPAGWTEENASVVTYTPAEQDCGGGPLLEGGSFNATYLQSASDGSFLGALLMSASALPPNVDTAPGSISDYGLSWSDGNFQYSVYAKANEPVARGVLVAIAQAMDPSLDVTKLTEQPSGVVEPQPAANGSSVASPPMAGQ